MAIRVRLPDETFEYTLRAERDSETPTVFTFRAPSARAQARLTQQVLDDRELMAAMRKAHSAAQAAGRSGDIKPDDLEPYLKGKGVDMAKTVDDYLELLRDCLVSVAPVFDPTGRTISMTGAQFLQVADFGLILELGPAALARGTLSDGDSKNSDAQPEPMPAGTAAPAAHG